MPNPQLTEYITRARASGMSDADIRTALLTAGWQGPDIEEALAFTAIPELVLSPRSSKTLIAVISLIAVFLFAGGGFAYWKFVYEPGQQATLPQEQVAPTQQSGQGAQNQPVATTTESVQEKSIKDIPVTRIPGGLTPQEDALIPKLYGVMVSNPPNGANLGTTLPGSSFDFMFKVTNTGDSEDTYTLSFTSSNPKWTISHQIPSSMSLKPQEEKLFKIEVVTPLNAKQCDVNKMELRAESTNSSGLLDIGNMDITVRGENIPWSSFDCPDN